MVTPRPRNEIVKPGSGGRLARPARLVRIFRTRPQKKGRIVGFGEEVIGAALQPAQNVERIAEDGNEDNGYRLKPRIGLDAAADLVAVDAGKKNVGQDQIEGLGRKAIEAGLAVRRGYHRQIVGVENEPQFGSLGGAVFDGEDAEHGRLLVLSRSPP